MFTNSNLPEDEKKADSAYVTEIAAKFTFEKINKMKSESDAIKHLSFQAFLNPQTEEFITFSKDRNNDQIERDEGLKLHISLANINDNIEKGWNIVVRFMIKNDIICCKVVKNSERNNMMEDSSKIGKEITIYMFKNTEKNENDWIEIIQEITIDLTKNSILPGPLAASDTEILGCNYISHVNHRGYSIYLPDEPGQLAPSEVTLEEPTLVPRFESTKEEDDLLLEVNAIRIDRARKNISNPPDFKSPSESSDSAPSTPDLNSSDSEARSTRIPTPESVNEIELPFKHAHINVVNQPKRMSYEELNGKKQKKVFSRTTSIVNLTSFSVNNTSTSDRKVDSDDDLRNRFPMR